MANFKIFSWQHCFSGAVLTVSVVCASDNAGRILKELAVVLYLFGLFPDKRTICQIFVDSWDFSGGMCLKSRRMDLSDNNIVLEQVEKWSLRGVT